MLGFDPGEEFFEILFRLLTESRLKIEKRNNYGSAGVPAEAVMTRRVESLQE